MGCRELIEALRSGADEKVRGFWQEAEKRAEAMKEEHSHKVSRLRESCLRAQTADAHEARDKTLIDAESRAREVRLRVESELSDRFFSLAVSLAEKFRTGGYEEVFAKLKSELPPLEWEAVRVNPGDVDLAGRHFPGVEIMADEGISGGMEGTAAAGKIRIINTFGKRLEKSWGNMLPALIGEIRERAEKDESIPESQRQ